MKILVAVKQVPDSETKVKIAADGKSLDPADVKWITSPYDEYALEEALRLKEAGLDLRSMHILRRDTTATIASLVCSDNAAAAAVLRDELVSEPPC